MINYACRPSRPSRLAAALLALSLTAGAPGAAWSQPSAILRPGLTGAGFSGMRGIGGMRGPVSFSTLALPLSVRAVPLAAGRTSAASFSLDGGFALPRLKIPEAMIFDAKVGDVPSVRFDGERSFVALGLGAPVTPVPVSRTPAAEDSNPQPAPRERETSGEEIAKIAMEWLLYPPYNPYLPVGDYNKHRPESTEGIAPNLGGSNWDMSCIGFVAAVMLKARMGMDPDFVHGKFGGQQYLKTLRAYLRQIASKDMQLMAGFPGFYSGIGDPKEMIGDVPRSFRAMEAVGRAHPPTETMTPGAAAFFGLAHFAQGHIAIFSGSYDINGEPLFVSTGAPPSDISNLTGIRLVPLSFFTKTLEGTFLGWAEI